MPTAAVITTLLQTHETRTGIGVYVGNVRRTGDVKWDTFSVTDGGSNTVGQARMHFTTALVNLSELTDQQRIRIVDHDAGDDLFKGYVISRQARIIPGYSSVDIIASDIGALLDDAFIAYESRPIETMKARIAYLWGYYATQDLSRDQSFVASIGSSLSAATIVSLTLRQAIEATISQASSSADYYVDQVGRLHVFTSEVNNAPLNINADAPGAGEFGPLELTFDYDSGSYKNQVYVQGENADGSGYFVDNSAVADVGGVVRTGTLSGDSIDSAAKARNLANMYLGRVSEAKPRGTFSVTSEDADGWRGGQSLTVTAADLGYTAKSFRIRRVTTTVLRPGSDPKFRYDVEIGGSKAGQER